MTRAALALLALAPGSVLAQGAMVWSYARQVAASPLDSVLALTLGIPETDAAQAQAVCAIGANWIYADLALAADVGGLESGAPVSMRVAGNRFLSVYPATVLRSDEGIWGLQLTMPLDDPFWGAIGGPLPVRYGVDGRALNPLPPVPREMALRFREDCAGIGELTSEAPPAK